MPRDSTTGNESAPVAFYATCTDCEFSREIDGQEAALQAADSHKREHGATHVVELYRLESMERGDE